MSAVNLLIESSIGPNIRFGEMDSEGDIAIDIIDYGEETTCYINISNIDAIIEHLKKQKEFSI
jgi:hypothetical protein